MTSIDCNPYDCGYYYEEYSTTNLNTETTDNDKIMINILESSLTASLVFLGIVLTTQISLLLNTCYKVTKNAFQNRKLSKLNNPKDKKIRIIRGVPGVGKRHYVYYLEQNLNRNFVICDWNDYFINNKNQYKFNGKKISEAEADCFDTFLSAINNNTSRIYIIGNFEKKWMYENYITVGKMNNYNINITELNCLNDEELIHYNNRSVHNVPMHKSIKIYNNWEKDERAYVRSPYLDDHKILQSFRDECLIKTDSDSEEYTEEESLSYKNRLPNVLLGDDNPQLREIKYVRIHDSDESHDESDDESDNESDNESYNESDNTLSENIVNDYKLSDNLVDQPNDKDNENDSDYVCSDNESTSDSSDSSYSS